MYDVYDPYGDDEERQRALEALGTIGQDPQAPDEGAAIRALAKESDQVPGAPQGSRAVTQGAAPNTPVQPDDDSGPGLNGWAIAADLVFNRGRGLGSIIGMAEQQKRDYLKAKVNAGNKAQEDALRQRALDQESRRLDYLENIEKRKENPPPHELTEAEKLAREKFEADQAERKTDNAREDARLKLEQDKASKGEAPSLELQYRMARDQRTDTRQAAQDEEARKREASLHADMPGVEVTDRNAWNAATMNAGERGKIASDEAALHGAVKALDDAAAIRREHGTELWGDQKAKYEAAVSRAVAGFAEMGKTGVLNQKEYERYREMIPNITPGAADVGDWIGALAGTKRDTHLMQLEAVRDELKSLAQSKFSARGARLRFDGDASPIQEQAVVVETPAPEAGDRLPVTGAGKPPALGGLDDSAAKSGKSSHRLKMPSGATKTFMLSDDELSRLLAAGAQEL